MAVENQYQLVPHLPPSRSDELFEGAKDAARAVRKDKVVDLTRKLSERDLKCKAGDAYSCGVASTLRSVEKRKIINFEVLSKPQPADAKKVAAGAPPAQPTQVEQKPSAVSTNQSQKLSPSEIQADNLTVGLQRSPVAKAGGHLVHWVRSLFS